MKAENGEAIRVKLCGLMTAEDCRIANQYRPDYAGFVFAKTRHFVTDETAAALRAALDQTIPAVGVFVDEAIDHVAALAGAGTIQLVQLHGREDAAYIAKLRERITKTARDIPIIRAVRLPSMTGDPDAGQTDGVQALPCDYFLLDTWDKSVPGGSGRRFDLSLLPKGITKPWFLAGGLTPDNVAEVLKEAHAAVAKTGGDMPFAVDVSSGVESEQAGGHKDEAKVARFLQTVRNSF